MLINFCAKHKNSLAAPRYFSYLIKMVNKCFVFGCYISERSDCTSFFTQNHTWWSMVNAKTQFCANAVAHAIVVNDGKIEFSTAFAD